MDTSGKGHAPGWRFPRASVYVVDSPSRRENTEILISTILERYPRARVLVVAERLDENSTFAFLRLGAKGLLRYSDLASQLIQALQTLIDGGSWMPRHFLFRFIDQTLRSVRADGASGRRETQRRDEVLTLLLENLSNKEIASRLHISSRTAKFHVSNLLAKYGVKRRTDLLMMRSA
jgi:NarL family two-component system response regulator LiaR